MLETNIRIVKPGMDLYIWVREATVTGTNLSPDLLERACGSLRYRGIAAIRCPDSSDRLLVATKHPIKTMRLEESDWALDVVDSGKNPQKYHLSSSQATNIVVRIIERAFQAKLAVDTSLWTLDSAAIWYEPDPFLVSNGIAAYRRYTVGTQLVDGIGVGIVTDVSVAFFTVDTLAHFFDPSVDGEEREQREQRFAYLSNRQKKQKGTLLYRFGERRMKCYFGEAPPGITCLKTGEIRLDGVSYDSLAHYYKSKYPDQPFNEEGRAVRVSFSGYNRPVWVAAELLQVRVMNDCLPSKLRNADKIPPNKRVNLLNAFWQGLGPKPFRWVAPGVLDGFWQPGEDRVKHVAIPVLLYGQNHQQQPPASKDNIAYKMHYQERLDILDEVGCHTSAPTMPRIVYFAYPSDLHKDNVTRLADDIVGLVSRWTKRPIKAAKPLPYKSVSDAIEQLTEHNARIVVFILDDDPSAYFKIAFNQDWRVKRITREAFLDHISPRGQRRWESFVTMNALAVIQLLDATPYAIRKLEGYEALLAIDVGHDRRHFAVSLLIARDQGIPTFRVHTELHSKADPQHETINPIVLRDSIVEIFDEVLRKGSTPLTSLLVLRDGEFRELSDTAEEMRETDGVKDAVSELQGKGLICIDAKVQLVDFRKDPRKPIRLWERHKDNRVDNPLEGSALLLNRSTVVLATTGAATLNQGTSQPVIITCEDPSADVLEIARPIFNACQLNWSNPRVAQRYPLPIKNADEELQARDAQEIRRFV